MTVSVWQELSPPSRKVSHDIVVIGAGMIGSYISRLLTSSGHDVAIVEAHFPAAGASGCNAGMVLLGMRHNYNEAVERFGHSQAREIWTMTQNNVNKMRDLAKDFGVTREEIDTSFIAGDEHEALQLRESAKMLQKDGFSVDFIDHDPLGRGFSAAMVQQDNFAIQPAELNQALARVSGANLYENDRVFNISREGARLIVRTRKKIIDCKKVLIAVNGYAALLNPFFEPLVEPARGQILLTKPLPKILNTMGLQHGGGWCYFRQLQDGRLLVGGGRLYYPNEERTYSTEVTPQIQNVIGRFITQYFPDADIGVSRRWAGIQAMTPDGLAIVGNLPDEQEVYFAVGFSGHGNSMGLIAGERVVELMLNGRDPGVFSIQRFE